MTFTAQVTGDPLAGVQQVWVTYTDGPKAQGVGSWASFDLTQDPNDSTRWTGTMPLGGRTAASFKFLVQAANGAGAVSLDTADGDGYGIGEVNALPATVFLRQHAPTTGSPLGVTAGVVNTAGSPVQGRTVRYSIFRGTAAQPLYTLSAVSDEDGAVEVKYPTNKTAPPVGDLRVFAELLGTGSGVEDDDTTTTHVSDGPVTISATTPPFLTVPASTAYAGAVLTATVSDEYATVPSYPVTFTFPTGGASASFVGVGNSRFKGLGTTTDANGVAFTRTRSSPTRSRAPSTPRSWRATPRPRCRWLLSTASAPSGCR